MDIKVVQAIMAGLVVITCLVVGCILLLNGIDTFVGLGMLAIAAGYLGIDLTPWIPLGKNRRRR